MWLKSWPILGLLLATASALKNCKQLNTSCDCHMIDQAGIRTKLQLSCPSDFQNHGEFVYKDEGVEVECRLMTFSGDDFKQVPLLPRPTLNFLPNLNESDLKSYRIRECPLPATSFDPVWEPMGVNNLEELIIENTAFPKNKLEVDYLHSISNHLVNLSLLRVELEEIDKEVFAMMRNLETLEINHNRLIVGEAQFAHLSNLLDLRLDNNFIEFIPRSAFLGLSKLVVLHLWSNSIVSLAPDTFKDLVNLRSLELSDNKLEYLPEDIFANLANLTSLNVGRNDLATIPPGLIRNNRFLKDIRIENMKRVTTLPGGFFANYTNLEEVKLTNCSLANLTGDLFRNSRALEIIHLHVNELEDLPDDIFFGLRNVRELKLNGNRISKLHKDLFRDLVKLETLYLDYNRIRVLPESLLSECKQLTALHLSNNEISTLALRTLIGNGHLTLIDMSNNNFSIEDQRVSPFNFALELEVLDLSSNQLTYIHDDFKYKVNLKMLNLNDNKFTHIEFSDLMLASKDASIFLQSNQISLIDMRLAEQSVQFDDDSRNNKLTLYVDDNPIICDCNNYDLFRYFNLSIDPLVQLAVQIEASNLKCAGPRNFEDLKACEVRPNMVTCDVEECPEPCGCAYRSHDSQYIVDCSDRNLTTIPVLDAPKKLRYKSVAVYLQNNALREGPKNGSGYEGISVLNLANNKLRRLKWIPKDLEVLNIENNNISSLVPQILGKINTTKTYLRNNPWTCDCNALYFMHYLKDHVVPNKNEIKCFENGKRITSLKDKDLCHMHEMLILMIIILAVIFVTVPSIIMVIYYKYNQEIKVWLYAHNMCLWFVTEEDLDKDKKFDAFISYSHVDEAFVVEELMSKLEEGPNPYKLCIHVRDWIPGEVITTQVTESVENSRRTVIVLSPNFLNSVWGKLEFRTAHTQALSEGRTRVIIILYGDIDMNANLDEELKAYLKTNTYIKWGDPWFWDKLRFALPHRTNNKRSNRKFENISVKIDKMDLIHGNMMANVGTTPPVDPLLSKLNPLHFKGADGTMVTPPAESGIETNHI